MSSAISICLPLLALFDLRLISLDVFVLAEKRGCDGAFRALVGLDRDNKDGEY